MTKVAETVVSYLELRMPAGVRAGAQDTAEAPIVLHRERAPSAARVALAFYLRVGGPWHWTDRLSWTEAEWDAAIHRDDVELWIAQVDDEVIGYFQLQVDTDAVELKYFGLLPEFTGRGFGRRLLPAAIERAAALGKDRMTVNTCTLDHPAALPNYLKHGFRVVRTETWQQALST
jgi:GNAT superfamily N-acetyltransferase